VPGVNGVVFPRLSIIAIHPGSSGTFDGIRPRGVRGGRWFDHSCRGRKGIDEIDFLNDDAPKHSDEALILVDEAPKLAGEGASWMLETPILGEKCS